MFAHRQRYLILALVTIVLGLAIGDRAALSVAGPRLAQDLHIDAVGMGWLFSSFAWSYVLAHLPAGWIVDRIGARMTVAIGLVAWSLASLLTALTSMTALLMPALSVLGLMVTLRVMSGMFQAPVGPASGMTIAAWFPAHERGLAGALYGSSSYLAIAFFTPVLGFIAAHLGWQAMFAAMAITGGGVAWWWWKRFELPRRYRQLTPQELDTLVSGGALVDMGQRAATESGSFKPALSTRKQLRTLFGNRMTLGIFISQYCVNGITWFFVSWFPTYLVQARGMTLVQAAGLAALPAICGFLGGLSTGLYSDRLLKRSGSLSIARKRPFYIGTTLALLGFVGSVYADATPLIMVLMCLCFFGKGFGTLGWTLVADIAPPRMVGMAGGAFNASGNISGIVTPLAIGYLVAATGDFDAALWMMAGHAAVGLVCQAALVGEIRRLPEPAG